MVSPKRKVQSEMKLQGLLFEGHKWLGNGKFKGLLIIFALLSMVLGSGADTQWGPE
jgi:hypothetical protein